MFLNLKMKVTTKDWTKAKTNQIIYSNFAQSKGGQKNYTMNIYCILKIQCLVASKDFKWRIQIWSFAFALISCISICIFFWMYTKIKTEDTYKCWHLHHEAGVDRLPKLGWSRIHHFVNKVFCVCETMVIVRVHFSSYVHNKYFVFS